MNRASFLLILAFAAVASPTLAQEEACADLDEEACRLARAEREFARGDVALSELRFADARDAFERSHRLLPDRGTAYNLGQAYRSTGQFVEALAIWTALLTGEFGELNEEQRSDVAQAIDEIEGWPARLCVNVQGPEHLRLSLGEQVVEGLGGVPACREVNPGRLLLRVDADGYMSQERRVLLERAQREELTLTLLALPVADDGRRRRRLWSLLLTGAALVGGGVALAVWLSRPVPPTFEPIGDVQALGSW